MNAAWSPWPIAFAKEALSGARDIMAEWMSEDAEARGRMQILYQSQGVLRKKMPQFEAQSLLAGDS